MTASAKTKAKKVFDIAKPSTVPAEPTTKSIIVGHGSLMRDPSIVAPKAETEDGEPIVTAPLSGHGMTIKPMTRSDNEVNGEKPIPVVEAMPIPTPVPEKPTTSSTPEPKSDIPKDENRTVTDPSADQARVEQAAQEADAKRLMAINALEESGKYFLPINRQEKRRNRQFALIGLVAVMLLVVAWLDVALDAGIIYNNYHLPHSHLFSSRR